MTYRYNQKLHHHAWDLTPIGLVWGAVVGLIVSFTLTSMFLVMVLRLMLIELTK